MFDLPGCSRWRSARRPWPGRVTDLRGPSCFERNPHASGQDHPGQTGGVRVPQWDRIICDTLWGELIVSNSANFWSKKFRLSRQILRGTGFTWVQGSYGNVPSGAVPGGNSSSGELLYIGRAHHEDSLTLGKIHRSHGCMYIPFDGAELSFQEYEVLVRQQSWRCDWLRSKAHEMFCQKTIKNCF